MNVMPPPSGLARKRRLKGDRITLAHGGGGKAMRDLIEDVFVAAFENPDMGEMEDQARLTAPALREAGVSDADIHLMTIENPRRIFTGEGPAQRN